MVSHRKSFFPSKMSPNSWQRTSEPATLQHPGEPGWLRRLARGGEVRYQAVHAFRKLHNFAFSLQFEFDLIFSRNGVIDCLFEHE